MAFHHPDDDTVDQADRHGDGQADGHTDGHTDQELIGVYGTKEDAEEVAEAARQVAGPGAVRVGDPGDERRSLLGEMQEEAEHTVAGPGNVGPFTKEMSKGLLLGTSLATVVGILFALPFAWIGHWDMSLGARLLIVVSAGAAGGAVFGFVIGGGQAAKGPARRKLAAERGTTVGVQVGRESRAGELANRMAEHEPLRLDKAYGDQPVGAVTTEEQRAPDGIVEQLSGTAEQEREEPDYSA